MADVQEMLKELLISSLEGAGKSTNGNAEPSNGSGSGHSHGGRGLAAGVGAAALAPVAIKGLGRLAREAGLNSVQDLVKSPGQALHGLGSSVGSDIGGKLSDKVDEAGGPGGIAADALKNALPFGGGGGGDKGGGLGVGKGRRMPVQQAIDIGVPLEIVYNQWTQYEEWPKFMHRVVSASQDEPNKIHFTVKIWTRTREFTAEIETQRPDERVKWKVSEGIKHAGVVTFHELGPNLTRVLLSIDVDPGGPIEKIARGARHVKRAARGDLHRFKAYIEMAEHETGAWRGVIEDGEVVEDHDASYDQDREYSDADEVLDRAEDEDSDEKDDNEDKSEQDDERTSPRGRRRQSSSSEQGQSPRSRAASRSGSSRSASGSGGSRSSRSGSSQRSASGSRSGSSSRSSSGGSGSGSGGSGRSGSSSRSSRSGSASGRSSGSRSRAGTGSGSSGRSTGGSSRRSRGEN